MFFRAIYLNKTTVLIGQSEGLPNIIGEMYRIDPRAGAVYNFSGAFTDSGVIYDEYLYSENYNVHIYQAGFKFDASRSNPIYGNNAHVTPTNATIKIWQRSS